MSDLPPQARPIAYILERVAERFGMTARDLLDQNSCQPVAVVRKMAMRIAQDVTGAGSSEIGRVFKRDHTTVLHAIKTMAEMRRKYSDSWTAQRMVELEAVLRAELASPKTYPQANGHQYQMATILPVEEGASHAPERIEA